MSQNSFISDADTALASAIWKAIESEPSAKNLISSRDQISFSLPKAPDDKANRKLSIFLYSINEEEADQASFTLRYLITPFTGNDEDDHALLGKIINALLASPRIVRSEGKNDVGLNLKMDSLSLEELNKLWIALGAPLRLSLSLTVSSAGPLRSSQAKVTSASAATQAPATDLGRATPLYHAVVKTFTEQTNDWKNRNTVVKQWLLQDFKKNTDMTVEEMRTMLDSLGDRMEQRGSTTQFIKPLTQLAGYYEHQLNELKGLHKVSRRQGENLKTIDAWIKEVRALEEALGGTRQTEIR